MAIGTALTLASMAGGTIANLLRPKPKFQKLDVSGMKNRASARLASQNALTESNIKQAGAAGRLPSGAIASSLAAVPKNVVDPNLDSQILNAEKFNAQQDTSESLERSQNFDDLVNFNLAGAGTLSKLAILKKYGFLTGEEENPGGGVQNIANAVGGRNWNLF